MRSVARLCLLILVPAAIPAANLRYWVQPCSQRETHCRPGDPELAEWAMEAWRKAANGAFTIAKTADMSRAHIRVYWASAGQGLYGEARPILVEGVRGAEVFVNPPPDQADILLRDAILYLTCLHESGHALGLPHTRSFDDIMYSFQYGGDISEYFARYRRRLSSRGDIRQHPGISAQDRSRIIDCVYSTHVPCPPH